ncbi:MAG: hypothetical protein NXY57DRAFT_970395 [Lentinula lateritia]|nr:MAG: hypothetical protein NXY57DRAFT_970395 [Lentinula lateritia]
MIKWNSTFGIDESFKTKRFAFILAGAYHYIHLTILNMAFKDYNQVVFPNLLTSSPRPRAFIILGKGYKLVPAPHRSFNVQRILALLAQLAGPKTNLGGT